MTRCVRISSLHNLRSERRPAPPLAREATDAAPRREQRRADADVLAPGLRALLDRPAVALARADHGVPAPRSRTRRVARDGHVSCVVVKASDVLMCLGVSLGRRCCAS